MRRSMTLPVLLSAGTLLSIGLTGCGDDSSASVSFESPADNARIAGAVPLKMSAEGLTIEAAGAAVDGRGHFHVIADAGCAPTGSAITKDADHVHFGKGQAEGLIYLEPGKHELCLQVGDGVHTALDVTDRVTVEVGITTKAEWCAVVKVVDDLFATTDNSNADFPTRQAAYANVRRLVRQLTAGLGLVDDAARSDVGAAMEFADALTTAVVSAADAAAADAATLPVFESTPRTLPGSAWIASECGVSISD